MPAFHVENFGCRATQADGAALQRQFEERGLARASGTEADVIVLNTCTVTAAADQDARAAIRRARRQNPNARIVVTGCYAQRAPEEIAALPGVSCVVGNSHKHQLVEIALREFGAARPFVARSETGGSDDAPLDSGFVPLAALGASGQRLTTNAQRPIFVSDIFAHTELVAAPVFDLPADSSVAERTRPNLKVQDGCDNRCSFCVIPYVRGQSRSLPLPQILREVDALVEADYREVVISGINLGRWGRDLQGRSPVFEDLIRAILAETSIEKIRISSVEPMDWSDELIALMAQSPRIAKHAHVPLQSGSDAVLRRMHRKYRPWHYREKIEKIRAAVPGTAIGADVMVGFPGETDAEFEATRRLIEELPFTYLHVFTYSARPGTPAAALPKQVPAQVARERSRILRDLAAEKKHNFMVGFIGQRLEAITLRSCGAGTPARVGGMESRDSGLAASGQTFTDALTDNYLPMRLRGRHEPNRWRCLLVESVEDGALVGSV